MAKSKSGKKAVAIAAAAVIIIVLLVLVYVAPMPPHYAFVSEKSVKSITDQNFTASRNSSSSSSTPSSSGQVSAQSVQYSGTGATLSIYTAQYNTTASASRAYSGAESGLGFLSKSIATNTSASFRGFTYFYMQTTLLTSSLFLAAGHDGKYVFLITGSMKGITSSQISGLVKAQIDAMETL